MDVKLIPQEIEYRAFQFALFKRKIIFETDSVRFNSKKLLATDIVAIKYGRINRVAGGRIAKSEYKIELKSKNDLKLKITFSHVVSQRHPEKIEKVYFDIINALTPVLSNILNKNLAEINSGSSIEFGNLKINKDGVEVKPEFFNKGSKILWENLNITYSNGILQLFDCTASVKLVASLDYNFTWNLKILEEICRIMIKEKTHQLVIA